MSFKVYDNKPSRSKLPALTVDKFARLYINDAALDTFAINDSESLVFYIGYDSVNRRIGLAKPNIVRMVDTRPIEFDKRRYAYVKRFLNEYNIDYNVTKRYIYVGKDTGGHVGWHFFELEDYDAPDAKGQEDIIRKRKTGL